MNRFQTELIIRSLPGVRLKDRPFEVVQDFVYRTDVLPWLSVIVVPAGYRTDLASIPRLFHRIFNPACRVREAAVVHDWLCDVEPKICNHIQAAGVFMEAMIEAGVSRVARATMYMAVRYFGPRFDAADHGGGRT
jgi:hypothetical protein